ncbi:hypothetical protein V6N11_033706 [Hibiscus sabdariffa]|uniref:Uncharacterized protein n=1 Tax=Hibiscus sabdariffa TaxID=183260 RepID=A0ABR2S0J6_9ROSI
MARRGRSRVVVGLAVALFLGIAVYFRLWAIQYSISSDDAELIRRQFDLANKEAMDESAEWRLRFDNEAEKASKCAEELREACSFLVSILIFVLNLDKEVILEYAPFSQIKESIEMKEDSTSFDKRLKMLQKENAALHQQLEVLKTEVEVEKRRNLQLPKQFKSAGSEVETPQSSLNNQKFKRKDGDMAKQLMKAIAVVPITTVVANATK